MSDTAFVPIKSFAQSFLTHQRTADALVAALTPQPEDVVLEIGPGKGILTRRLLQKGCRVIAVEIDRRLVNFLRETLGSTGNLTLIQEDFLKFDIGQFTDLKIIGNLPYNISSQIILKLIDNFTSWKLSVLTAQREFVRRILAQPGTKSYGAIAVLSSYRFAKKRLFDIPAKFFKPAPRVTSTTFLLSRLSEPAIYVSEPEWFLRVVHAAFTPQRRKTLLNNLCLNLRIEKEIGQKIFSKLQLPLEIRAEEITLEQFGLLSEALRAECQ